MTLRDLAQLIRNNARIAVVIPVICMMLAVFCSAFFTLQEYRATSFVVPSVPAGIIDDSNLAVALNCLAEKTVGNKDLGDGVEIEVEGPLAKKAPKGGAVAIAVTSSKEGDVVSLANSLAEEIAESARSYYRELFQSQDSNWDDVVQEGLSNGALSLETEMLLQKNLMAEIALTYCDFMVDEAVEVEEVGVSPLKLVVVSGLFGIALAVGAILAIDSFRKPIKKVDDVKGVIDSPVLGSYANADVFDAMWTNIQFVIGDEAIGSICLVPLNDCASKRCGEGLVGAIKKSGRNAIVSQMAIGGEGDESVSRDCVSVRVCRPLYCEVGTAVVARNSTITIVCIEAWKDSVDALRATSQELSLAKVKVAGVVLLPSCNEG